MKAKSLHRKTGAASRRHIRAARGYWTPRKMLNLVRCELEKRFRVAKVDSMPFSATIDLTNICNLSCPGCPTGAGLIGRKKSYLEIDHLQTLLDQIGDFLLVAHLYNWGESLLHPKVTDIVSLVHNRRIYTCMSSNLSIANFSIIEEVCDAGLDELIVSIDGVDANTYQKYRTGGNFELVVENLRRLVAYKKATGKRTPHIEWQMLAFNYLEHEIDKAYSIAKRIGVDSFNAKGPTAPSRLQPSDDGLKGKFYGGRTLCSQLWHNVVLQSEGGIAPCCNVYYKNDDFGHIDEGTLKDTRNNDRYLQARRLFDSSCDHTLDELREHPCCRCPLVHRQHHLADQLNSLGMVDGQPGFMGILNDTSDGGKIWQGM